MFYTRNRVEEITRAKNRYFHKLKFVFLISLEYLLNIIVFHNIIRHTNTRCKIVEFFIFHSGDKAIS